MERLFARLWWCFWPTPNPEAPRQASDDHHAHRRKWKSRLTFFALRLTYISCRLKCLFFLSLWALITLQWQHGDFQWATLWFLFRTREVGKQQLNVRIRESYTISDSCATCRTPLIWWFLSLTLRSATAQPVICAPGRAPSLINDSYLC